MAARGSLTSKVREGQERSGAKFADYFDFSEPFTRLPSHRVLALFRGEKEEVLDLTLDPGADDTENEARIAERFGIRDEKRPADPWLNATVHWAWRTRILMHLSVDIRVRLWQAAEDEAVRVFAANLRDLLLAAPAGARTTMGLDPGFRTGVKVAITDATGKVLATATIYPHEPQRRWDEAIDVLAKLAKAHKCDLIAIGNGTASRETDRLAAELIKRHPDLELTKAVVSEAGASVYSASAYASAELPGLDVSLRGAVSIARRLQDPLAELVKIDPKSIGVGQYQHDVAEGKLSHSLDAVVEDCVNAVGVDLNTASQPLLARVSGVTAGLAAAIVARRDTEGPFRTRQQLMQVPRLGQKAFEQCAGFLRIRGGDDPLDASGVHPEAYPVVRRILAATGSPADELIGKTAVLRGLRPQSFTDDRFGLPTVTDILRELEKPGRDPRPEFATATFAEGVEKLEDLEPGMVLEGVVTNVAAFGAFVDVGVHQDGLVHVSAMSRNFVADPHSVVKSGDVVRVKVLSVDIGRHRISLTLRLDDEGPQQAGGRHTPTTARQEIHPERAVVRAPAPARADPGASGTPSRSRAAPWPTPCAGPALSAMTARAAASWLPARCPGMPGRRPPAQGIPMRGTRLVPIASGNQFCPTTREFTVPSQQLSITLAGSEHVVEAGTTAGAALGSGAEHRRGQGQRRAARSGQRGRRRRPHRAGGHCQRRRPVHPAAFHRARHGPSRAGTVPGGQAGYRAPGGKRVLLRLRRTRSVRPQ